MNYPLMDYDLSFDSLTNNKKLACDGIQGSDIC